MQDPEESQDPKTPETAAAAAPAASVEPRESIFAAWRRKWQWARAERAAMRRMRELDPLLSAAAEHSLPKEPVFLACMLIARGEDAYLVEWLEFHRMMGIEHFFFYDNGMQPSTAEILKPYVEARLVTHLPFPDLDWPELRKEWNEYGRLGQQEIAYAHCVTRFGQLARYWAKIDVDEFLYPARSEHAGVADALRELDPVTTQGLEIPRVEFGHDGRERRGEGLVIERFTRCGRGARGYKSVGNSVFISREARSGDALKFIYRTPLPLRLVRGLRPRTIEGTEAQELLRLNHYFSKSLDEYLEKGVVNSRGYMAGKESKLMFFLRNRGMSTVDNGDIQRFLPALRERIAAHTRR